MISAVVLAHNDEKTIEATLKSLSWCDETIVIDDDSQDKTVEIAKKNGSTVFTHALKNDFAAQRNFGLSKVKLHRLTPAASSHASEGAKPFRAEGEWALFVDSDEVVSPTLANEIREAITKDKNGYYVKRKDWMWGKFLTHGETSNVRLLRLAKLNAGFWERSVHEVWRIKGAVGELTEPLLHYPHQNVAQFLDEINMYSTLNAKVLYDQGVRANALDIILYPLAKFFVNYIWRLGFLDGTAGMVVALLMSMHSFLTRSKLFMLAQKRFSSW